MNRCILIGLTFALMVLAGCASAPAVPEAADPEAMKSPIQQIYEMYSPPHNGASAPLHQWAPLSKSFQALMEKAGANVISFDPITDGADVNEERITMEAAGSAVIVRIGEGADQHVIVYDVVEEDGDWRVSNIRAPLAAKPWDLQVILADAGIRAP
jgi:hypothetical protein